MKNVIVVVVISLLATLSMAQKRSFHDFTVKTIDGNEYNLSSLKGKRVLVVNVASKCGLTPQYAQLQELYEKYNGDNFVIIGFPCNDFKEQESGTNEEIAQFCEINYGVTFPLMDKVDVKGDDKSPIYKWLTEKTENGVMDAEVQWNFQKFMIDENGKLIGFAAPQEKPFSKKIINWIERK